MQEKEVEKEALQRQIQKLDNTNVVLSLLLVIATTMFGFGVNLATSSPDYWLGWVLSFAGSGLQLLVILIGMLADDYLMSGLILSSIANTYAREGDFEHAKEYYSRATDTIVSIGHRDTIINGEKNDLSEERAIIREQWRVEETRRKEKERDTLRRRSYWAIALFSISLLALVVSLIFFLSTRNPVILLSLEIPVIFFTLVGGFLSRRVERPHST